MKVVIVNGVCGIGSTGKICHEIAKEYEKEGHTVKIAYGRLEYVPDECVRYAIRIGNKLDVYLHALLSRITDRQGFYSTYATQKFIEWLDNYNPDILWLHNLHGYYINIEKLFKWIKKHPQLEVKWTLHDCWSFTGHCTHFTYIECNRWKTHCYDCPQKKDYPTSLMFDQCKRNYENKRDLFTGIKNLNIIVPSKWLANLVSQSFLKEYPVKVQYNKVDKSIFKPTPSDFRARYGIEKKIVILGVAGVWTKRKGLYDFFELSQMLSDAYVIVLVGLNKKQMKSIPKEVIGLNITYDMKQLASIYTAADFFLNPSREETFGMTTVEAALCGAKPIVYKGTAGEEIVATYGGVAINSGVDNIYETITGEKYSRKYRYKK